MSTPVPQRPTRCRPSRPGRKSEFLAALGRQVRESRERRGLARKAVSQSAGVSERYLAQLEAGEGNASVLLLRSVARALDMPLTELIDPRESSVEKRLIRRFLDRLARASAGGRGVPADARLRRGSRHAAQAHRARRPARRGQDHARQRARRRARHAVRRARPRDRARSRHQPVRDLPALRPGRLPAHRAPLPRAAHRAPRRKW